MCGISGYIGPKNAVDIVLAGLKTLEYRGYDSWGIAAVNKGKIAVQKKVGKVGEVDSVPLQSERIAIAHTRWATHGTVTEINAHPHLSNNEDIAVVHNGIIENFQEQRAFLKEQGFKFKSDTDTEIIPLTIDYHMKRGYDFVEACKKSFKHLEGQYAIVAIHAKENKMVGIRKEAPLVVGIGKDEYFIASDIPAFLEHTKDVIFLHEKELVVINNGIQIFDLENNIPIKRNITSIDWDAEQAKKGDFQHFMLKEISEQAEVIKRTVNQSYEKIKEFSDAVKKAKGIFLIGCGTAYHACLSASYTFSKIAKKHVNVILASEFPNYIDFVNDKTLIIAVSQSGETADVLSATRSAKKKGAKVISVVNVMGSSLMRESDTHVQTLAGPEICVLSTKSYTTQLAILNLIAYELAGKYKEGKAKMKELIRYVYYLTSESFSEHIKQLSEKLRYVQNLFIIGRSSEFPTALEAALKIKEVSYIHAEGFAGGELKHGSIALIDNGTPCIVFTSRETEKEIISNALEIKARGGYIIGVGPKNNEAFDFFIKVFEAEEANSICQIIPIQVLAYQLALLRGKDPDKPRNLAKSVTVK